jgi:uncharacterized protein YegL
MSELDSEMPGGPMARRAVRFIWLLDASASMAQSGKIAELNFAIREAIPELRRTAESNPAATLLMQVITFSSGTRWVVRGPISIDEFTFSDIQASGATDMGAAFEATAADLNSMMDTRALRPVLVLVSDGMPTDDWRAGLRALDTSAWGRRAVRVAIGIGQDADFDVLREFLANPELEPLRVNHAGQIASAIRWGSTVAVRAASIGRGAQFAAPWTEPADDDEDVW